MEIYYNPNVVYLLLVLGFFLAILALFSPGTGMLEAGALLILIAAGWGIYNNARPINLWAVLLLAIGVFPFLLAMRKWRDVIFLAIAIVAFAVGSVYLFEPEVWYKPAVNPILAGITIVSTSLFLWIAGHKVIEADKMRPSHDLSLLLGQVGEARQPFTARALSRWQANSGAPGASVPSRLGRRCAYCEREGLILKVEKA